MSSIFISYASEDRDRVRPLADALERVAPVWWDPEIEHGQRWNRAIADALRTAECVVVVWTAASVESEWVQEEATVGKTRGVLVPVLLDDVPIPLGFGLIQAAKLSHWRGEDDDPELARFLDAVGAMVRSSEAASGDEAPSDPPPPSPRTPDSRRGPAPAPRRRAGIAVGSAAVGVLLLILGFQLLPALGRSGGASGARRQLQPDTAVATESPASAGTPAGSARPRAPREVRVEMIVVTETGTPTLRSAMAFLSQDRERRGYHYLVDRDGSAHAMFDERTEARHTRQVNETSLAVGMVHMSRGAARSMRQPYTPYPPEQLEGLAQLLARLVESYRLSVTDIRSKEEIDPRADREITDQMVDVRLRVGRVLAERRMSR